MLKNKIIKIKLFYLKLFFIVWLVICKLTAMDVMEDLEKSRSASLNFLLRGSFLVVGSLLADVRYLSQPRIILPYR